MGQCLAVREWLPLFDDRLRAAADSASRLAASVCGLQGRRPLGELPSELSALSPRVRRWLTAGRASDLGPSSYLDDYAALRSDRRAIDVDFFRAMAKLLGEEKDVASNFAEGGARPTD